MSEVDPLLLGGGEAASGTQGGLTEQTRRRLGATCTIEEELMEVAQTSLQKLAPISGGHLDPAVVTMHPVTALDSSRSVNDAEIRVSRGCETKTADRCNAFWFNYECFVLVCYGLCSL